jgi:hypothetical protein
MICTKAGRSANKLKSQICKLADLPNLLGLRTFRKWGNVRICDMRRLRTQSFFYLRICDLRTQFFLRPYTKTYFFLLTNIGLKCSDSNLDNKISHWTSLRPNCSCFCVEMANKVPNFWKEIFHPRRCPNHKKLQSCGLRAEICAIVICGILKSFACPPLQKGRALLYKIVNCYSIVKTLCIYFFN